MRKWILMLGFSVGFGLPGFCQNAGAVKGNTAAGKHKDIMLKDVFEGSIPANGYENATELILEHQKYYDIGAFTLSETSQSGTLTRKGQWTVIKGSARDDNATVVELDIRDKTEYYLRLKNGNLQKLDTALREIKPVGKYVLVKQGK